MRCLAILVLGAAACGLLGANEPPAEIQSQVQQLTLEVKALRLELYRVTLRQISADSAAWQRELELVRSRLARLDGDDRASRDRQQALEQQFSEGGFSQEERREMKQLEGGGSTRIAAEREKLRVRESEIAQYLGSQSQAWTAISAAANQLEAELRTAARESR